MNPCDSHCHGHEGHEGCGGCGHDHRHEAQTVRLELEDGSEVDFAIVGAFEVDGRNYFALLADDMDEVLLCRYEDAGDEVAISQIETDEEYEEAAGAFTALYGGGGHDH